MPERPGYRPPEGKLQKHPLHIKDAELQKSPEVERAVGRQEFRAAARNKRVRLDDKSGPLEDTHVPKDPSARIEAYMSRLEKVFLNPDEKTRVRNIELFRDKIYDQLLIKREKFPESYFELQKRVARERGQAIREIPQDTREQMIDTAIADQKASLDSWIDYLSSDDAAYPAWFKYFVWKNIIKLSQFDKQRGEFKKRTDTTVAPFPDIHREPLAKIADIYLKVKEQGTLKDDELQEKFGKKFPSLYAELIHDTLAASIENREEVAGTWVKYEQGNMDQAEKLYESLENKGTGWCTAGSSTARYQVSQGDFHVYYTNDRHGNPVDPRIAVRMNEKEIAEVRGILPGQELEPIMQEVLDKKLEEYGPTADRFKKRSADMKWLTALVAKKEKGDAFTDADLRFLYQVDGSIQGFGYERDDRIAEMLYGRDMNEDAPALLGCTPEQISFSRETISNKTKTYVGPLFPGIFELGLDHVYTSLHKRATVESRLAREILRIHLVYGGKAREDYEKELDGAGISYFDEKKAKRFLSKMPLAKNQSEIDLVLLTLADLDVHGEENMQATIKERAASLGLDYIPLESVPALCLSINGQPIEKSHESFSIWMRPLPTKEGKKGLTLRYLGEGGIIAVDYAEDDEVYDINGSIVFSRQKQG